MTMFFGIRILKQKKRYCGTRMHIKMELFKIHERNKNYLLNLASKFIQSDGNLYRLALFFLFLAIAQRSYSYPEFIAYGYNSCVSCHYNSQGGGVLNEYGKAVMATEISSRVFLKNGITDDELGENAGFPGSRRLPSWIRPGIKYRGLWFVNNPSPSNSRSKFVNMQADLNGALLFDEDQKYVLVGSIGYNSTTLGSSQGMTSWISREHYMRWQPIENLLLYFGLLDVSFGVRNVDHTAVSRQKLGLAQNDQAHGVMAQWRKAPWDFSLHGFLGNYAQDSGLRQKGVSLVSEYDVKDGWRIGTSLWISNGQYLSQNIWSVHSKFAFQKGDSLISEIGILQKKPQGDSSITGLFGIMNLMSRLTRGVNFISQFEYFNETMSTKSADQHRFSGGLLFFPAPRFEFRALLVNSREISDTRVREDQWQVQSQLHLSM